MTHLFITGDSHTVALKRGLSELADTGSVPQGFDIEVVGLGGGQHTIEPFFEVSGDRARMTHPLFLKRVAELPLPDQDPDTVYAWCGLFHFAKAWRDRTWLDFRPADTPGDKAPVSMGLISETVVDWFQYQLGLLDVVRRSGARVLALESPRPFRHHWALKRIPADVVTAVDSHCQRIMVEETRRRGIELVRIPERCLDEQGFMLPEWRHEDEADEHHGGTTFGKMMILQACEYLRHGSDNEGITNL